MPTYNYRCADCGETFTVRLSYDEVDSAHPACPACGGADCERIIGRVSVPHPQSEEGSGKKEEPFKLTREHVEAAIGYSNLMSGAAEHTHDHDHGDDGHHHHHDHDHD